MADLRRALIIIKPWLLRMALLIALLIAGIAWRPLAALWSLVGDMARLSASLREFGLWGSVLLILAQVAQVIFAVIPGDALLILSGRLYGFGTGFAMNLASTVGAGQIAFALARWGGRPIACRLVPAGVLDRWDEGAKKRGFLFFLVAFLVPILPCDVMNFVAGLSPIPSWHFLAASLLGRIPIIALLTLVGSSGLDVPPRLWIAALIGGAGLSFAWHCRRRASRFLGRIPAIRRKSSCRTWLLGQGKVTTFAQARNPANARCTHFGLAVHCERDAKDDQASRKDEPVNETYGSQNRISKTGGNSK